MRRGMERGEGKGTTLAVGARTTGGASARGRSGTGGDARCEGERDGLTGAAVGRRARRAGLGRALRWFASVALVPLVTALAGCAGGLPARRSDPDAPAGGRAAAAAPDAAWPEKTYYRTVEVRGRRIFYREAGRADRPVLLLLHGFPSSSHSYRELIPLLSGRYRVVAPDYLGSGFSEHPGPDEVTYTFDLLADHVTGFTEALGLARYVLYMQDFGAPVGFRVAMAHPERLRGLVVQNGNAYLDGLPEELRAFIRRAHEDRSQAGAAAVAEVVSGAAIRDQQYLRHVPGERRERMSPDSWTHDLAFLATPEDRAIQVQLLQDYQTNIDAYPAWQAFLRARKPPTLVVWGRSDADFIRAGASAYLRDLPGAELHLLDAGHFAVEEQAVAIAQHVTRFLERLPP
ncbi:alpha/beta fold hydrolase [Sorangium sp. So ce1182]|uniref:alpha/beta fold hydrolase n=1 Tax=Sorangium sp. So ce1182 TaxID=3133334 RepID=UPI003F5E068B